MFGYLSFLLFLAVVSSANALTLENFDYHNGQIGTGLVAAATSFAVNEVRSDGWWMGITTSLSYAFCRSCDGQIYAGDRLYLLTDIYQRSTPSDTYDSLLESGTPRLKRCTTILTVDWVTPPSFKLNYIECTNESVSSGSAGEGMPSTVQGNSKGKRNMMGGWSAADSNSDAVLQAALFATDAFNKKSNAFRRFALHYVTSASSQIVAGVNYRLDMVLRSTPCRKTDEDNLKATFECDSQESNETEFQRCSIVVWDQPWVTPRYQASTVDCKSAGIAKKRQGNTFGWFDSTTSLFKLGDSQWILAGSTSKVLRYGDNQAESTRNVEGSVEVNSPDSQWFALFVLSGPRSTIAKKFSTFSARFNRTYVSSPNMVTEGELPYYRFTQNAARVAVARLAELGTAEYDLSTSLFADMSYTQFCSYLPSTTNTGADENLPWPLLQFYKANVAQPWSPIFDTTIYRLVAGANAQSLCSNVAVRVGQCGSKACRSLSGTKLCTLPFCSVETVVPSSSTSSETSFTFLSASAKAN